MSEREKLDPARCRIKLFGAKDIPPDFNPRSFCRYTRVCQPEQFAGVDYLFANMAPIQ